MKINVKLPIVVNIDNIGAVFMANNKSTNSRTKHVDIHTKYVNQYVEDGIIKVVFVKSGENVSDIFTKNLGSVLHNTHAMRLITEDVSMMLV